MRVCLSAIRIPVCTRPSRARAETEEQEEERRGACGDGGGGGDVMTRGTTPVPRSAAALLLLLLLLAVALQSSSSETQERISALLPGDFLIGALFSIHHQPKQKRAPTRGVRGAEHRVHYRDAISPAAAAAAGGGQGGAATRTK
ncbi:Protein of unknown function [Gryllus bimaculatus]|nr:Protein of unknown function [Gryllus bimaculatus]